MFMLIIGWLKLVSSCKATLLRLERLPWGRPFCPFFSIIGESKFLSPKEMWRRDVVSKSVRCCIADADVSATFDNVADRDGGRKEDKLTRCEVWLMMFIVDSSIREVVSTVSYFFSFTWNSFEAFLFIRKERFEIVCSRKYLREESFLNTLNLFHVLKFHLFYVTFYIKKK